MEQIRKRKQRKPSLEGKTSGQLKRLARDIVAGKVFTDRHVRKPESYLDYFRVLKDLNPKQKIQTLTLGFGLVYEYTEHAKGKLRGKPVFDSCKMLTREDAKKIDDMVTKLMKEAKKK